MGLEIFLGIAAVVLPMLIRALKNRLANKRQPGGDSGSGDSGSGGGPLGLGILDRLRARRRGPQPSPSPTPSPALEPVPVVIVPNEPPAIFVPRMESLPLPGGKIGMEGLLEAIDDILAVADYIRERQSRTENDA